MVKNTEIPTLLVDEILAALKDEKQHYFCQWENVGKHPASRHKREYRYFSELVDKLEAVL